MFRKKHLNCHHPKNICFKNVLLKLVISLLSDLIQVNKAKFRDWFLRITMYLWCIFYAPSLVFRIWWMFILMPAYKYVWPYLHKKSYLWGHLILADIINNFGISISSNSSWNTTCYLNKSRKALFDLQWHY